MANIDEIIEKYLGEGMPKKQKTPFEKIRKPTAPPTKKFKDKNRYDRKKKHKGQVQDELSHKPSNKEGLLGY